MKKLVGPLIFIVVAAVFGVRYWMEGKDPAAPLSGKPASVTAVSVLAGGEKMAFLNNPRVREILESRYGIQLNAVKAGSIEMVNDLPVRDQDALWPSNQIAAEIYRKKGGAPLSEETLFNSPIVIYAYDIVADALIRQQIVEQKEGCHYISQFDRLIALILEGKSWGDIGLPQLYGRIAIHTTDPTRSNSGNMFAGLLANMMNRGNVLTSAAADEVAPKVQAYFNLKGFMEYSSGDIFKSFITTGVGAKPMIVGYENQLVEFIIENDKYKDYLRQKIRILYPVPTVWSSHPILALTSNGKRLIDAMKDREIQTIAWERHGFRSGLLGVENDPKVLDAVGIPKEITAVIPMPDADVMTRIIQSLTR